MRRVIIYRGQCPFKYFLISLLDNDDYYEVSEREFFKVVGYDRTLVPIHYDKDNINRQNFYLDGQLIAFRVRQ